MNLLELNLIRPLDDECPQGSENVENGYYW